MSSWLQFAGEDLLSQRSMSVRQIDCCVCWRAEMSNIVCQGSSVMATLTNFIF